MSDTSGAAQRYADDQRRYRLDSRIATGGMGEVWRGTDTTLGRPVAVKLLKPEYADDPTFRSRFSTEARHAAALHHPGVASVYDVGESHTAATDGSGMPRPFLVMELVDGQPLSALLRGGRAMAPDVVRDLLAQAAAAVGAAHRAGIVHRDLKPANLLVTPERKVKITDFGIARATDGLGLTGTGQVMGTPQYLSPEQARGNPATPASDVYSLGVVAYECLVGHRPFEADSPVATALAHLNDPVPTLPATVPADLAAVVRRSLAKRPDERFPDGAALAAALRDPTAAAAAAPTGDTARTAVVVPVPEVPTGDRTQVLPVARAAEVTPPAAAPAAPVRGQEAEEGRGPWPVVFLLVALLAVGAVIVVLLVNRGGDDTAGQTTPSQSASSPSESSSSPSQSQSSAATFSLEEGDYVGRNIDDVVADLKAKGLRPDVQERDNPGGQDPDTVIAVKPTTGLQEGDTVTVSYWGQEPDTPTPTPTPTPSDTPTPTPSSSPSPSQSASQSSSQSSGPGAGASQSSGPSPSQSASAASPAAGSSSAGPDTAASTGGA